MTKIPYIPIKPESLNCPRCAAKAGQACVMRKVHVGEMLEDKVELIHVERIKAAAMGDITAKKALRK